MIAVRVWDPTHTNHLSTRRWYNLNKEFSQLPTAWSDLYNRLGSKYFIIVQSYSQLIKCRVTVLGMREWHFLTGGKYLEFPLPRPRGVNGQKVLMSFRPSLIKTPPIVDISHKNAIPAWQSHLRSDIKLTISPGMAVADFYINKELYPPSQRKIFTYEFYTTRSEGKAKLISGFSLFHLVCWPAGTRPGWLYRLSTSATFNFLENEFFSIWNKRLFSKQVGVQQRHDRPYTSPPSELDFSNLNYFPSTDTWRQKSGTFCWGFPRLCLIRLPGQLRGTNLGVRKSGKENFGTKLSRGVSWETPPGTAGESMCVLESRNSPPWPGVPLPSSLHTRIV